MATPPEDTSVPKGAPREKDQTASKHEPARHVAGNGTEQIIFTMRAPGGEVVKVEKVDAGGNRQELSKEDIAGLVGKNEVNEIEDALDEAFEAGISSVLDPDSEVEENPETADELALRRELPTLLVGSSVRQRLQRRIVQHVVLSQAASRCEESFGLGVRWNDDVVKRSVCMAADTANLNGPLEEDGEHGDDEHRLARFLIGAA